MYCDKKLPTLRKIKTNCNPELFFANPQPITPLGVIKDSRYSIIASTCS